MAEKRLDAILAAHARGQVSWADGTGAFAIWVRSKVPVPSGHETSLNFPQSTCNSLADKTSYSMCLRAKASTFFILGRFAKHYMLGAVQGICQTAPCGETSPFP